MNRVVFVVCFTKKEVVSKCSYRQGANKHRLLALIPFDSTDSVGKFYRNIKLELTCID